MQPARSQTIRNDSLCLPRSQVFVLSNALDELRYYKTRETELLGAVDELSATIVRMDKDNKETIAKVNTLSDSRDKTLEEYAAYKVKAAVERAKPRAKPFSIGPSVQYGFDGKQLGVSVGIGLQYSLLRF